jgi:hypothetical protein
MSIVPPFKDLEAVMLVGCCIYDEDVDDIATELQTNTIWKKLDLTSMILVVLVL